jgi:hypothetical protein
MPNPRDQPDLNLGEPGYDPYNHHGRHMQMFQQEAFRLTGSLETETVFYTKGRNWFQRWMIGFLFGWKVINE